MSNGQPPRNFCCCGRYTASLIVVAVALTVFFIVPLCFLVITWGSTYPTVPTATLVSFSQSGFGFKDSGGVRSSFSATWNAAFDFFNPSSRKPVTYYAIGAYVSYFEGCSEPVNLAETGSPEFRQEARASTLVNFTLQAVDFPLDSCLARGLLVGNVSRFRIEVSSEIKKKVFGKWRTLLLSSWHVYSCSKIAVDLPTGRTVGRPNHC